MESPPLPRISTISEAGVLEIKFDRPMRPPINTDVIPDTSYIFLDEKTEEEMIQSAKRKLSS